MFVPDENVTILLNVRVALHTLGCKVNAYESDAMTEELKKAGAVIVPFTEKADIYLINTCSVTNIADRKSRQMLNRARKMNPEAIICATGCYAQIRSDRDDLENVPADLVIGNNEKNRIAEILAGYLKDRTVPEINKIREEKSYCELILDKPADHTRAYLKVQDGCDQFCSYCIIPFGRGRVRSRNREDVLEEAKKLSSNGVKEFVLTGIHLSSYGMEEGMPYNRYIETHEVQEPLISLIEALNALESVKRIRLGSLEPRLMNEAFVKRLSACEKICPQFHLSLQSGCLQTLKRMNRHYTPEDFSESVRILRKYYDMPALTTDVISGFPGETEEEFEESYEFIKKTAFYELHVFPYSRRKGTAADMLPGQLTEQVKKERADRLIRLSEDLKTAFEEKMNGKPVEVLTEEVENTEDGPRALGYTKEYIRVCVPGYTERNSIIEGVFQDGLVTYSPNLSTF